MAKRQLTAEELRVLQSLLLKLGMATAGISKLMRQHGVSDGQITEADLQSDVYYERVKQLGG